MRMVGDVTVPRIVHLPGKLRIADSPAARQHLARCEEQRHRMGEERTRTQRLRMA